jgi:hypothetical protein
LIRDIEKMFSKLVLRNSLRGDDVIWNSGTSLRLYIKAEAVVNNAECFGAMHMTGQTIKSFVLYWP